MSGASDLSLYERFSGNVLYHDAGRTYAARGAAIFQRMGSESWLPIARIPAAYPKIALSNIRYMSRFLRLGIRHIEPIGSEQLMVFGFGKIWIVDVKSARVQEAGPIHGSNPMNVCVDGSSVWYGEYDNNPERQPIRLWRWRLGAWGWHVAYTFRSIRHIHGIFRDPLDGSLWVTTGDRDSESAIWRTDDNFRSIDRVAGGSQRTRVVQLLFDDDRILFGTDTPTRRNSICCLSRGTGSIEKLAEVEASVFFAKKVRENFMFSTACEPSTINETTYSSVWSGNPTGGWSRVIELRKDPLPSHLFGYGTISFPAGEGDNECLWLTPHGTEFDGSSLCIPADRLMYQTGQGRRTIPLWASSKP